MGIVSNVNKVHVRKHHLLSDMHIQILRFDIFL